MARASDGFSAMKRRIGQRPPSKVQHAGWGMFSMRALVNTREALNSRSSTANVEVAVAEYV
jgi:hypothetical protein